MRFTVSKILMVLGEGKAEAENHRVDQSDNFRNIDDGEAAQSAIARNARQVPSFYQSTSVFFCFRFMRVKYDH